MNRRHFFRHGLSELLRPLAKSVGPFEEVIRQIGSMEDEANTAAEMKKPQTPANPPPIVRSALPIWLRPPGALPEAQFRQSCSKCDECVKVCPVQCIKMDPTGEKGAGVPYIDVDANPCVMCDGLLCMHSCPTGALTPIPISQINMGTAIWHESTCLRSHGHDCTICVEQCPIGEMAIRFQEEKIQVVQAGCTGCGVCQNRCPTTPKSITIAPRNSGGPVARKKL